MIGEKTKIWQASLIVEHGETRLAEMVCLASRLKIHLPLPPSPHFIFICRDDGCYSRGKIDIDQVRADGVWSSNTRWMANNAVMEEAT